jgi:hypothetical protein
MFVPVGAAMLLVYKIEVRRAPVLRSGQTCTNRFLENALREFR